MKRRGANGPQTIMVAAEDELEGKDNLFFFGWFIFGRLLEYDGEGSSCGQQVIKVAAVLRYRKVRVIIIFFLIVCIWSSARV